MGKNDGWNRKREKGREGKRGEREWKREREREEDERWNGRDMKEASKYDEGNVLK